MSLDPPTLGAVVLWSTRADLTVAFFRALGIPLEAERHGRGPQHWACGLEGRHFAVHEAPSGQDAPGWREAGAMMLGLEVPRLDDALAAVSRLGATVVQPVEEVPWGRRVVVRDPDGRPVELYESGGT